MAYAQTTINGNSLSMKSVGTAAGSNWRITENGYVGTYIELGSPGNVTISVNASGAASGGIDPRMNIVLADYSTGWDVGGATDNYEHTFTDLPAGRYFLRTEFNNDIEHSARELTVNSLTVTGATVSNTTNSTTNNANALASADTYINNFRKGNVSVALPGASPGTSVEVSLKNHAFNFGTAVAGGNFSTIMNSNPSFGSDAYKYQEALKTHFNALVPENAGKWVENEWTQDSQWHPQLDKIVNFANANDKRLRMHNVLWGTQQPGWVNTLISQAAGGNMTAQNTLRQEISERIDYYVGDGVGADLAQQYYELDVYNETVHTPQYWNIYGADGIADIYNEVADAVDAAGADVKLFTNEYNVLQDDGNYYGNWYKENIESILAEGGEVSGIGIQSYENNSIGTSFGAHYPARKMQTLQNLSVLGMPITLTEFGVKKEPGNDTSEADATTMLDDTARLVFGTPNATGFFMWGFWSGDIYRGGAALYDEDWNLREPGERWVDLFSLDEDGNPNDDWTTQFLGANALEVGPDGTIDFSGFWGDYELTIGGETYDLSLVKGTTDYLLAVAPFLAGDYNGNDVIDAADYSVWRDAMAAGATSLLNDPTPGTVDESDFLYWRSHFGEVLGSGAGSGSLAAVPEPAGAALLLLGSLAMASVFRRKS